MSQVLITIALVLVAAALMVTGWIINASMLWSATGNMTVPWLCSALAISLLIVAAACAICQRPPAAIAIEAMWLLYLGVVVVLGAGIVVDAACYHGWNDLPGSLAEWLGFSIILLGCFWIPRLTNQTTAPPQ